jgi:hypothetical protein
VQEWTKAGGGQIEQLTYPVVGQRDQALAQPALSVEVAQQEIQPNQDNEAEEDGPLDDVASAAVPPGTGDAVSVDDPAVGEVVGVDAVRLASQDGGGYSTRHFRCCFCGRDGLRCCESSLLSFGSFLLEVCVSLATL